MYSRNNEYICKIIENYTTYYHMLKKEHYSAPKAETLLLASEEALLAVSGDIAPGQWTGGNDEWWDDDE